MASLESLTPDQRAVLDLVLRRGRSYDDIAGLLAIDRAAVRARALAAFDEIGPETGIPPESRALITDYLLGQLPGPVAEQTRERLAESPYDRAWARVVAAELEPLGAAPPPAGPGRGAGGRSPSRWPPHRSRRFLMAPPGRLPPSHANGARGNRNPSPARPGAGRHGSRTARARGGAGRSSSASGRSSWSPSSWSWCRC